MNNIFLAKNGIEQQIPTNTRAEFPNKFAILYRNSENKDIVTLLISPIERVSLRANYVQPFVLHTTS